MKIHTPGDFLSLRMSSPSMTDNDFAVYSKSLDHWVSNGIPEATARLIAAAPELFTIAQAYRNLLRTMAHTEGEVATFHHIENILTKITTP